MSSAALRSLLQFLQDNPTAKFGFVVYRCTYGNDADWKLFMDALNAQAQNTLEANGMDALHSRLDWNVQEDPALDEASYDEVRRHVFSLYSWL